MFVLADSERTSFLHPVFLNKTLQVLPLLFSLKFLLFQLLQSNTLLLLD